MRESHPDSNINMIEGGGGIFNVKCDGKLIYSKQHIEGQRFPDEGEITKLIEKEKR